MQDVNTFKLISQDTCTQNTTLISKNKGPEGIFPELLHCMQYDRYCTNCKA